MDEYIFHINHPDGNPFIIHPFTTDQNTKKTLENDMVHGIYGAEPRTETIAVFRNFLYRKIEQAVNIWIKEDRFIYRFLFGSAMFLCVYLLMTFLLRDPLPLIDELLLGLAAGFFLSRYLYSRDKKSITAVNKRVFLRDKADRIRFSHHPGIDEIEAFIRLHENNPREKILEKYLKENDSDDDIVSSLECLVRKGKKRKRKRTDIERKNRKN